MQSRRLRYKDQETSLAKRALRNLPLTPVITKAHHLHRIQNFKDIAAVLMLDYMACIPALPHMGMLCLGLVHTDFLTALHCTILAGFTYRPQTLIWIYPPLDPLEELQLIMYVCLFRTVSIVLTNWQCQLAGHQFGT